MENFIIPIYRVFGGFTVLAHRILDSMLIDSITNRLSYHPLPKTPTLALSLSIALCPKSMLKLRKKEHKIRNISLIRSRFMRGKPLPKQ